MKSALPLLLGLAGGVLGGLLAGVLRPEPAPARVAPPSDRPPGPTLDEAGAERIAMKVVEQFMKDRPPQAERTASGTAAPPRGAEGEGPGEGTKEAAPEAPDTSVEEVIRGLKGKHLTPDDTNRLFSFLSLHKDRIQDVVTAIQKEIAADPTNPELQVALATAYVADLMNNTVPGPQQGLLWMKASAAYDAAIKLDPEHWTARFGKAFGTSMAPEFLGMRPQAIHQFEELLEIQKRKAPEPYFASTYFRLGTLYKDAGNVEKAREIWNAGLALFPDNEELKGTIEVSTKK